MAAGATEERFGVEAGIVCAGQRAESSEELAAATCIRCAINSATVNAAATSALLGGTTALATGGNAQLSDEPPVLFFAGFGAVFAEIDLSSVDDYERLTAATMQSVLGNLDGHCTGLPGFFGGSL